jgi:hypothetical protein
MMKWRGVAIAAGSLVLATCCPTLWLTVTQGDPMPRFAAPLPAVARSPIVRPPTLTNRCDVPAGKLCEFAPDYQEDLDPHGDTIGERVRALSAFQDELPRVLGPGSGDLVPVAGNFSDCSDAFVRCNDPAHNAQCVSIETVTQLRGDSTAIAIDVNGRTIVKVINSIGAADPALSLGPSAHGSYIQLGGDIDASHVRDGMQVHVCASSSLALSRPLFTFIHMSDIQLRDGSVKLEDAELSHRLDWVIQSFEYDPDLQFYNPYVLEALFATINADVAAPATAPALRPSLIVHTGDSIDSGVMSELRMFHRLVHRLSIPLFEVFGNHDMLVFGNLLPTATDDDGACATVESVSGHHAWSWLLPNRICVDQKVSSTGRSQSADVALVASPDIARTRRTFMTAVHDAVYDPAPPTHGLTTTTHGFELHTTCDGDNAAPNCKPDNLGYYMFAQPIELTGNPDAKLVFVALNSEDLAPHQGGTYGRIGNDQAHWLEHVVDCERVHHPRDLMLVFAHQPISLITVADDLQPRKTLESILASSPNTVAYLYGHDHLNLICGDGARACKQFWEIQTSSVIEFPQEARMVTLAQVTSQTGFLDVFTFGAHLDPAATEYNRLVELARRGAEHDDCRTHPEVTCSDDLRPYRTDGRDTNARLFFHLPGDAAPRPPAQPASLQASSCSDVDRWREPDHRLHADG